MIIKVTENIFRDYLTNKGFSYDGITALFDYLETNENNKFVELDVIEICGIYTEYEGVEEYMDNHKIEIDDETSFDEDEYNKELRKIIEEKHEFINIDGTAFIIGG